MPFIQMDELTKNTFAVHVVAASASVALGTTIIYPLDSLTALKQVRPMRTNAIVFFIWWTCI